MKLLSYILAFYVILLSGVPCCSFDDCRENKIGQTSQHDQKDNDCGDCSPFFSCSGCSVSAFTIESFAIQLTFSNSIRIFTGYIEPASPDMHYDFWQPPKIA